MITTNSKNEAFEIASAILGGSFYANEEKSSNAGYSIWDSDEGGWISDLGNALEVNHKDGKTTRISIVDKVPNESSLKNLFAMMDRMSWSEYKNLGRDGKVFYDHLHEELSKMFVESK